jgi:hypothetical protein
MALGTGHDVLHSKDQPRYAIMQRDVQQGVLRKRLAILHSFLMLGKSEWSLRLKFTVTGEIRRIQEQMELQNMARCRVLTSSFNINSLSDEECLIKFRFMRKDVGFISELIPWDQCLDGYGRMRTARRRYRIDPMEATAIFLRRLSTVARWVDVQEEFGKHTACLTEIFYHTLELFHSKFSPLVTMWRLGILQERAEYYSKVISEKGSSLDNVVGFIDGTAI